MSPPARFPGLRLALVALAFASVPAGTCGFEDPSSAGAQRGMLSLAFPKALYVTTAVWQSQLEGLIPRDEGSAATRALFGYQKTVKRLGRLRDGLAATTGAGARPSFSVVLIGPMLWTRFEAIGHDLTMTTHAKGPSKGDVVIITDEPVIAALAEGRIGARVARERGLLRFYGADGAVRAVIDWLDTARFASAAPEADAEAVARASCTSSDDGLAPNSLPESSC